VSVAVAILRLRLSTIPSLLTNTPLSRSAGEGLGVRAARAAGEGLGVRAARSAGAGLGVRAARSAEAGLGGGLSARQRECATDGGIERWPPNAVVARIRYVPNEKSEFLIVRLERD
jgi:hypothetical protein